MRSILLLFASLNLPAQNLVFLEPLEKIDTNRAEIDAAKPLYRRVDGAKYLPWLDNDAARRALRLYTQAWRIAEENGNPQRQPREYFIALVPDGNHASVGLRVKTEAGVEEFPRLAYMLLDPNPRSFASTLLHETGHVAMAMLAGGRQLPRADICSIPHSTAALSDRGTAFAEGYAIHLETLAAHLAKDGPTRARFHHEAVLFGDGPFRDLEYFRHSSDLATYSQSLARYAGVRENEFAFQPAYNGKDYLRIQLERARDFASLRDANQLLQSEGFYASFFFLFLMRGSAPPLESVIEVRQDRMLRAMAATFSSVKMEEDTPWLAHLAMQYMKLYPDEKTDLVEALNDLSHGVFVDRDAARLWQDHYLAALRLDRKGMEVDALLAARKRWRDQVAAHPELLLSRLGPQLPCEVKAVQIKIEAFGEASPLLLDINTAPEAVLRLVPDLAPAQIEIWLARRPFASMDAFRKSVPAACRP